MFVGEYNHSVDEKGRIAVPSRFRSYFKNGAVVTKGLDNCLFLYSMSEWKDFAEKLVNLPISQANSRAFARHMLAGAMDVKLDKQGRIVVPDYLRKVAKIGKKAVFAGLYNRIEIWDEKEWERYKKNTEESSTDIAEKMGELGI